MKGKQTQTQVNLIEKTHARYVARRYGVRTEAMRTRSMARRRRDWVLTNAKRAQHASRP